MKNRRTFLLSLTSGVVALAVLAAPVIAEELLCLITKVDVPGKTLSVLTQGAKAVKVKVDADTEIVTKKGTFKVTEKALEKISAAVTKYQEATGKKGLPARIEHEKGVASKINTVFEKKAN